MKKRKGSVFATSFLVLVMCSSFVSALAKPLVGLENNICIEEHKHNEGCNISTSGKEEGKDNGTNETEETENKDGNSNDSEDTKLETDEEKGLENNKDKNEDSEEIENNGENTGGNKGEEALEEENKVEESPKDEDGIEEPQKDENKEETEKEEINEEDKAKEEDKVEDEEASKDSQEKVDEKKPEEREYKNPTTDTFEKVVGDYSFNTILNKYNVFSRDTVTGSHIVGPIVGLKAYSIQEDKGGSFKVADYSNKVPSFIGELHRIEKGPAAGTVAQVALNYGFEYQAPPGVDLTVKPNLYVNETGNQIRIGGTEWNEFYEVVDEKGSFKGPNNWGNSPILQNDKFVDFDRAFDDLIKESNAFLKSSENIVVDESSEYKIDSTGNLKLDVGKSYLIKDASKLLSVNFIYPEGFDPLKNPYPEQTIINISDDTLAAKVLGDKRQNLLPDMYVNGIAFTGHDPVGSPPGFGDGQVGEMNRIIWNMPNIKTVGEEGRLVRTQLSDILGHIVAPNAEFWNYRMEGTELIWTGGNINGAAIVKSWHGGTMESHFWPYNGVIETPKENKIAMSVNAKKIFNKGSLDNPKFNFTLEYDGESLPEGIMQENIPQTVQQKPDGTINFLPITFTKEGTYNFKIKEIKGDDPDIIYDNTEYLLKITVFMENGEFKLKTEVTKVSNGNSEVANEIVFVNEKKLKFTIEKKDKLTGNLLEGAIFDLYEGDETGKPKGEPIIKDIATDKTGKITVSNQILEYNKLYVLVETKAPEDYMTGSNIIFYIKGEQGPYPDGEGIVVIENGGNVQVFNTKSDEILPETGGVGTDKFIFVGLGLMVSSLIIALLKTKLIKR
ncbi:MAG: collagen-binding domain-containing protein [Clostridium sp.]